MHDSYIAILNTKHIFLLGRVVVVKNFVHRHLSDFFSCDSNFILAHNLVLSIANLSLYFFSRVFLFSHHFSSSFVLSVIAFKIYEDVNTFADCFFFAQAKKSYGNWYIDVKMSCKNLVGAFLFDSCLDFDVPDRAMRLLTSCILHAGQLQNWAGTPNAL